MEAIMWNKCGNCLHFKVALHLALKFTPWRSPPLAALDLNKTLCMQMKHC